MPQPRKRRVHYVPSTHWDREWHTPLMGFRPGLVRLLDRVIEALESGALPGPFQTDGQSILLEDYLEIRPDRRERVEKLARAGKLAVGPWYSMPDEFTVSGEAIIRNLLVGRAQARAYGAEPACAGYIPDMFGHNSQLPQIFAGCGVTSFLLWRGVNDDTHRNFLWRGADGTVLPGHKFGKMGYGTFQAEVGRSHEPLRRIEDEPAEFARLVAAFLAQEAAATDVSDILIHDACDHQEWSPRRHALLVAELAKHPDRFELVHSSLDGYMSALIAQRAKIKTRLTGELREPGRAVYGDTPLGACNQWVIPGVLSSRVRLKQANARCQTLLTAWAEPFTAFASAALGEEFAPGFLDLAWRRLLQNHAHDSMDGCSVDQVHADMEHRFDECRVIAEKLTVEATSRLAASVTGDVGDQELRVTVFNPLARDFSGVTEIKLEIPTTWPGFNEFFGFEAKPGFRIFGPDGAELPYQRLAQAMNRIRSRIRETKFAEPVTSHHITVALRLAVPALGYTTLTVRAVKPDTPTRHPAVPGLATGDRSMANEHLAVQIEANGTVTLTDRRTRRVYRDLLTFEDRADIGDGWYHGVAVNDQVFTSTACRADVALVSDGPLLTTFRIRTVMSVPAEFHFDRMVRSERFTDLVLDTLVSLRPGQTHLDVQTTVANTADDHRVRVLLPSGTDAATYLADTPFDVVERPIALRPDNHEYRELEVETKPQQTWTAVHGLRHGLSVVSDGVQLESAVRDLPGRPIALTLFRGFRRTVFTDGEPGGQSRGPLSFRYAIVPLAGAPDRTALCELGQRLAAGLRAVQLRAADVAIFRGARALPATAGWLRIDGPAVVSSLRHVGGSCEIRFFNPHPRAITIQLRLPASADRAAHTDFEGNVLKTLRIVRGAVTLALKPKQIATVRVNSLPLSLALR
ncbi:MAG: glycoside hydrolase family 38 [Verrucomicrobia bacterium]|nr:glycoside hydrolase family 38 [Verrucomicrobiota bacterium]